MFPQLFLIISITQSVFSIKPTINPNFLDICGINNGRRLYLELGIKGTLSADYKSFIAKKGNEFENYNTVKKCTVEFVTCPSCVIELDFSYLNVTRNCGKTSILDTCSCNYVFLNEPSFEDSSGEQFCGRFKQNNVTHLTYTSKTRSVAIEFTFNWDFGHAFSLDFKSIRNKIQFDIYPKTGRLNNASQTISSPFFPHLYPTDLSVEYVINCHYTEFCRINLVFTDFLLAESSIIEFFDWNGSRMYVTSGSVFRPPVILSSGPSLTVRFYANGASDFGFKASYSFILGETDGAVLQPNLDCGGHVANLGGGITMMNMVNSGTRFFDCLWLIKPPSNFMHRKTHLYVKVVNFSNFAGVTELIIRQGLTSNEPVIETLRYPLSQFNPLKQKEHVVPISEGFYINLRGSFKPESQVTIVYAAFNYKDCFSGLDFLCHNLRCISLLLNCDGFDHCGDHSDESNECSQDPRDHRRFSQIPNFLFPKNNSSFSDLTTATFVFLMCTFGLIGIIFTMALLLYRVNVRARDQRRIQDHLETIHAILEEGVVEIEEELINPDDPPDYEPPPEYTDVLKYIRKVTSCGKSTQTKKSSQSTINVNANSCNRTAQSVSTVSIKSAEFDTPHCTRGCQTSRSSQTTPNRTISESPPPAYENILAFGIRNPNFESEYNENLEVEIPCSSNGGDPTSQDSQIGEEPKEIIESYFSSKILNDLNLSWKRIKNHTGKTNLQNKNNLDRPASSEENILVRFFSDSEIVSKQKANIEKEETWFWGKIGNIKRSFSTTDLF